MCNAFSAVITIAGDCYWKAGLDSHEDIIELFKPKDKLLVDDKHPSDFVRVEIIPKDNDYLNPYGKWLFKLDDKKPVEMICECEVDCDEEEPDEPYITGDLEINKKYIGKSTKIYIGE